MKNKYAIFLLSGLGLLVLPLLAQPFGDAWVRIIDIALLYVMLALGLNIVVGYAGLLDLGYVAFYAVGAYSYALLAKTFGFSFWMLLPLAGILEAEELFELIDDQQKVCAFAQVGLLDRFHQAEVTAAESC